MAFASNKKKVTLVMRGTNNVTLMYITDIGEVEGMDEFTGFYREGDDLPFHIVSKSDLISMSMEDHVQQTRSN